MKKSDVYQSDWKSGFTLVEVMFGLGTIAAFMFTGAMLITGVFNETSKYKTTVVNSIIVNNIRGLMSSTNAVRATIAGNPVFGCIADDASECNVEEIRNQAFRLVKANGETYYDADDDDSGFTQGGDPCVLSTEEGASQQTCPYRVDLFWEPVCPATGSCRGEDVWRFKVVGKIYERTQALTQVAGADRDLAQASTVAEVNNRSFNFNLGPFTKPAEAPAAPAPTGPCHDVPGRLTNSPFANSGEPGIFGLTEATAFLICTPAQWNNIENGLNPRRNMFGFIEGFYKLGQSLDFSGIERNQIRQLTGHISGLGPDGQRHKIRNLVLSPIASTSVNGNSIGHGLIRMIMVSGKVSDLIIEQAEMRLSAGSTNAAGILVDHIGLGMSNTGYLQRVAVVGSKIEQLDLFHEADAHFIGGIWGSASNIWFSVEDVYADVDIEIRHEDPGHAGTVAYIGGVGGYFELTNLNQFRRVYSKGEITIHSQKYFSINGVTGIVGMDSLNTNMQAVFYAGPGIHVYGVGGTGPQLCKPASSSPTGCDDLSSQAYKGVSWVFSLPMEPATNLETLDGGTPYDILGRRIFHLDTSTSTCTPEFEPIDQSGCVENNVFSQAVLASYLSDEEAPLYSGWDFVNVWGIRSDDGLPHFLWE